MILNKLSLKHQSAAVPVFAGKYQVTCTAATQKRTQDDSELYVEAVFLINDPAYLNAKVSTRFIMSSPSLWDEQIGIKSLKRFLKAAGFVEHLTDDQQLVGLSCIATIVRSRGANRIIRFDPIPPMARK